MANGRYDPILSENVIEGLFKNGLISKDDYRDYQNVESKLSSAILTPGCGAATQNAAIAAVYELGKKNQILRQSAIEGLTNILSFHSDVELKGRITNYINNLKSIKD